MKKLILILIFCPLFVLSQKARIYRDSFFQNYQEGLLIDTVFRYDSLTQKQLMNLFENWGGSEFINFNSVKTHKSEDQMTLYFYVLHQVGLNLIAEFQDKKMRIRIYDLEENLKIKFQQLPRLSINPQVIDFIEFYPNKNYKDITNQYGRDLLTVKNALDIMISKFSNFEKTSKKNW